MRLVLPYLAGYVWQKDPFRLTCSTAQPPPWHAAAKKRRGGMAAAASAAPAAAAADHPPPCLWGVLHFGDNIEDEWFVVSLLLHLTKQLPGVSAQVWDNDGEFLLIEAALDLPRWLKPETSAHRVWLRGGGVHIVPLPSAQHPSLQPFPTLSQALQVLRSGSVDTRAPKIEQHVVRRLRGYPAAGVKQMQRVRCVLPLRAAAVLRACPQLVAPAVEAFYLRDADDMRTAARMQTFPPQVSSAPLFCPMNQLLLLLT